MSLMQAKERFRELVATAKARGLTQTALARRVGEDPMWVTNRLTGHSQIHADDVPKIARGLNIDPCDFFRPVPAVEALERGARQIAHEPGESEARLAAQFEEYATQLPEAEMQELLTYVRVRCRLRDLNRGVSDNDG